MIAERNLHWTLFWLLLAGVAALAAAALCGVDGEGAARGALILAGVVLSAVAPHVLP
jgi:hypothetical protein